MPVTDQAFVTLATNDVYSKGALVVGQCLRQHGTSRQTVVMVTQQVSQSARAALAHVFCEVREVNMLDSLDCAHLNMIGRPELGVTLTKLCCWTLIEYTKCVFLDADTLVLCNVDELFDYDELSAAPDPGWPDCFNSGVFVFRPSLQTYDRLLRWAEEHGSFDGGDQGLLNSFFSDWATKDISKHLPFIYNLSTIAVYTYLPAFQQYGRTAKIVHFLGAVKPWHCKYERQMRKVSLGDGSLPHPHLGPFLSLWWVVYCQSMDSSFTATDTWQEPVQEHQKVGSVEVTLNKNPHYAPHVEDPLHIAKASTLTAPNEMSSPTVKLLCQRTYPEDPSPGDEDSASELTPPQDSPPSEEGGAIESRIFESSQSGDPMLELSDSISELPVHLKAKEDDLRHKHRWEEGRADYLGEDAFDNIKKKLDRFLK
ncbi:hypothetical protein AGOR_G00060800 [Albula goreensis]|uniref:glycogenin glucosyltransferase n=1 Tax=Albula goreensis TaxID=1534307 RepID=A0A8T3DRQ5_9TELE|nr:hypothetical protein AGOR_G00060800 [Albula goreensis]